MVKPSAVYGVNIIAINGGILFVAMDCLKRPSANALLFFSL